MTKISDSWVCQSSIFACNNQKPDERPINMLNYAYIRYPWFTLWCIYESYFHPEFIKRTIINIKIIKINNPRFNYFNYKVKNTKKLLTCMSARFNLQSSVSACYSHGEVGWLSVAMPCLRLFQLGLLLFINVSPAQQTSKISL